MVARQAADGAHLIHKIVAAVITAQLAPAIVIPLMGADVAAKGAVAVLVEGMGAGFLCMGVQGDHAEDQTKNQHDTEKLSDIFHK
jgi:hypothetical protein